MLCCLLKLKSNWKRDCPVNIIIKHTSKVIPPDSTSSIHHSQCKFFPGLWCVSFQKKIINNFPIKVITIFLTSMLVFKCKNRLPNNHIIELEAIFKFSWWTSRLWWHFTHETWNCRNVSMNLLNIYFLLRFSFFFLLFSFAF